MRQQLPSVFEPTWSRPVSWVLRLCALVSLGLAPFCSPAAQAGTGLPSPARLPFAQTGFKAVSARSEAVWQEHLASVHQGPVQSACEPFRLQAKGNHRGSLLLLHGFTACPQQFWDIAPKLAAAGFDVYVPLLPGHGQPYALKDNHISDDLSRMPVDEDYRVYQNFGVQMSDLVRDEPGVRLLSGLSLGGVIAATALLRVPEVYDRALLLSPLFNVVSPSNLYVAPVNFFLPGFRANWGPGCEDERAGGRGGYCQFLSGQVRAVQRVGLEALRQMDSVTATVQVVGVEGDGAADNESIGLAVRRMSFGRGCLFRKGANHSLLSLYDAPKENKFWLPALHRQLLRFVESDTFFDTEPGQVEAGLPLCKIP